jgi:hypothetical protein
VDHQLAQPLALAPGACLHCLDDPPLPGSHPPIAACPVDAGPGHCRQARGRLSLAVPHGTLRPGGRLAASAASGHTRGKSAALQREAISLPLSVRLPDGLRCRPHPLPAPPFPSLAVGRFQV